VLKFFEAIFSTAPKVNPKVNMIVKTIMKRTIGRPFLRCSLCLLAIISSSTSARAQDQGYTIQIASAPSEAEARALVQELKSKRIQAYWVKAEVPGKGTRYRVRIGRFTSQSHAKAEAERTRSQKLIQDYLITTYEGSSTLTTRASEVAPDPVIPPKSKTIKQKNLPETETNPDSTNTITGAEEVIPTAPLTEVLTDIGNTNWKVARPSKETDKNLRTVYFVDSITGWAAGDGGVVYRTTDGGRTWKPLVSGSAADIRFIFFTDWNHGWMIGEMNGKESTETLLFITTDGGRTWARKALPNILSLHFTDARNGWAIGKDAIMLRTTDGGEEWSTVPGMEMLIGLPVESSNYNFGFRDIFFLDPQHGWMIGNFDDRDRSNIGGLFVTSDGGQSWKRIPLTMRTERSSGRFTPGSLHSVRFTDVNTGSVTGEMYDGEGRFFFVLHTRDGGKSWEQFRTPSRAVHSTQFLDPLNGWMAAFAPREGAEIATPTAPASPTLFDTTLMRTDNGGQSWQKDLVARGRRIHSLFFLSRSRGWAVGDRGMILRYENKQ
jgi:photosystem II stability/assembly factor-like uncharacterized protein